MHGRRSEDAGARRCRLIIQSIALTPTEDGATTETPTTFAAVFASIRPMGGREIMIAREQQDTSTHILRFPYVAGITAKMQGVYAGRVFNFVNVNNVGEMNREIMVSATEVTT